MLDKLKYHLENRKYLAIYRKVNKHELGRINGYILAISEQFVLLQETDDFRAMGYVIIPLAQIKKLRYNNTDKYYDKIMHWEKEIEHIKLNHTISLENWQAVFNSLKAININVIIECESSDINTFNIGPIVTTEEQSVHINYFDSKGFLDTEVTIIDYPSITKVLFDDRYINVFSKYTRYRKN